MKVRDLIKQLADDDLDNEVFICVDKLLMKPIEEERYGYISISEVKHFGSCCYCEPVYSSGIDYNNLPPVNIKAFD